MFLEKQLKYIQASDLIFSMVYGNGIYRWTGSVVMDPLHPNIDMSAPLLENIKNGELYFIKRITGPDAASNTYRSLVKHPPKRERAFWPSDLILLDLLNAPTSDLFIEQFYGNHWADENSSNRGRLALLFPYREYRGVEDGVWHLKQAGKVNWRNPRIRDMIVQIAKGFYELNQYGYVYLDFHFSRFFFKEDGSLFFDFTNLLFFNREKQNRLATGEQGMLSGSYPIEFAEPAIVQQKKSALDVNSQNYSLTALFFYLMFHRYAYEGSLMDGYRDQTEREHYNKFRDYHKMPVFIFDPEDSSNALGDFEEEQEVNALWEELPQALKDMFIQTLRKSHVEQSDVWKAPSPEEWLACLRDLGWCD